MSFSNYSTPTPPGDDDAGRPPRTVLEEVLY